MLYWVIYDIILSVADVALTVNVDFSISQWGKLL